MLSTNVLDGSTKNNVPGTLPKIVPARIENIPEELKDDQWVNWRYEWRQNDKGERKLTKVPRTPHNTAASHGNSET
jgi:hypothetical protein